MTDSKKTPPEPEPGLIDSSAFTEAYMRRLPQIKAVPQSELVPINVDIYSAVITVLGALPEIKALAPQMAKLPINHELVDGLEDYAEAAGEANARYVTASAPEHQIVALYEDAMQRRETLRVDATSLTHHGLIDPRRLSAFKGFTGYKNVAFELIEWANLMSDVWSKVQGKTALTAEDIKQAKEVGQKLVRAAGLREQGPAVVAETAVIRQQAYTLLARAWDEVRRAVGFLRWKQGDADSIAPTFYLARAKGRRPAQANASVEPDVPAAAEPVPVPTATQPPNGDNGPGNGTAGPTNGTADPTPGMPGTSPLAN